MSEMTAQDFETLLGRPPDQDDLHRVNCDQAGEVGHRMCGICLVCNAPNFICGGDWAHPAQTQSPDPFKVHGEGSGAPRFELGFTGVERRDFHFRFRDKIEWEGPFLAHLQEELRSHFTSAPITKETRSAMVVSVLGHLARMVECGYLRQRPDGCWDYRRPDKNAESLDAAKRRAMELNTGEQDVR